METVLHITVISNIIFEPYFVPMIKQRFGENTVIFPVPFGEQTETEYQTQLVSADLIVVWLNLKNLLPEQYYNANAVKQDLDEAFALCKKLHAALASISQAKILWFSFDDYALPFTTVVRHMYLYFADKLNLTLRDTLFVQISFIDLKHLIAKAGVTNACDLKGKYRWNAPYTKTLVEYAVKEIYKQYLIKKDITKKCLVIDCDNVLWGGILSEMGFKT